MVCGGILDAAIFELRKDFGQGSFLREDEKVRSSWLMSIVTPECQVLGLRNRHIAKVSRIYNRVAPYMRRSVTLAITTITSVTLLTYHNDPSNLMMRRYSGDHQDTRVGVELCHPPLGKGRRKQVRHRCTKGLISNTL